ncbi:MAK10-like protein [Tanacetum coccineum]
MGDENPIRTLRDYSKPNHEGYRNTIKLPVGNNMVLLRSTPSSCGPHDTQYCMEDPEQAFVEYASSRTNEAGESLELDKNGSTFVQGEIPAKMEDPRLFALPCRLGDSKPLDTMADLGSCVNIIPLYLFKNLNIELLEETDHIFGLSNGTKSYPIMIVKDVEVHIGKIKLLNDF